MSICENFEKTIGTMTLEASIYEDGYVLVALVDQLGFEIASLDGTAQDGNTAELRTHIESTLIEQHYNE
ncbi:hypothetical protein SEA_PLATTE_80 [Microbacterium phage Platte]|nr:hypothetical protein SEA_HORTUS1_81 [Microbacterium phage Hortus1]AWY05651.1 hypothetical protein SEA_OLINDD_81 [Microbacterium phage OlinDD]AWY05904.1 hypothetical protein SEA_PIONEER3_81 [Microbacterium phage Pioneer3]AWY06410.1 hypothetical protein SEA_TANDEM_81 [Microbacterium phage Tandem]QAU07411.1 hypothetical protein SEA_ALLEB_79 [Microbacterium phage Alleb]QZD97672.1 hypothetical protein SEA_PLATTE_80 [Microbacterium phage Platte]